MGFYLVLADTKRVGWGEAAPHPGFNLGLDRDLLGFALFALGYAYL